MPRRKITTTRTLAPLIGELEFERLIDKNWFRIIGYREYKTKTVYLIENGQYQFEVALNKRDLKSGKKTPSDYAKSVSELYHFFVACDRREREKKMRQLEEEWRNS